MATQNGAYEDGELEIPLGSSATRRGSNSPRNARSRDEQGHSSTSAPQPQSQYQGLPAKIQKQEQRIGAYQIMRTLGEGSFGKVKLAVHRSTNQQVALKIIARRKLISRDMAGRVEREIEYLQLLRHPHIIKLYAFLRFRKSESWANYILDLR